MILGYNVYKTYESKRKKKKMYSTKFQPLTIFAKDSILDVWQGYVT